MLAEKWKLRLKIFLRHIKGSDLDDIRFPRSNTRRWKSGLECFKILTVIFNCVFYTQHN
jgi:hypothetical protein